VQITVKLGFLFIRQSSELGSLGKLLQPVTIVVTESDRQQVLGSLG
jgi:hypothetical protein